MRLVGAARSGLGPHRMRCAVQIVRDGRAIAASRQRGLVRIVMACSARSVPSIPAFVMGGFEGSTAGVRSDHSMI